MGAIGFFSGEWLVVSDECQEKIKNQIIKTHHSPLTTHHYLDLSVAIRTMTIKNQKAVFNVGGGIVIDSIPEDEYEETLTKAKALLNSLSGKLDI
jgi:para-aminobenzoate synthetase component 1